MVLNIVRNFEIIIIIIYGSISNVVGWACTQNEAM
jgi:hypothetical protein